MAEYTEEEQAKVNAMIDELVEKAKKASDTNEVKETTKTDVKKEISENNDTKKENKKEDK